MRFTGRNWRRALWSTVGALVVVAGLTVFLLTRGSGPAPVASTTASVQRGTVTLQVAAAGTVVSSQTRGLSFSVSGTVTEVDVKAGDVVTAGQVLARIDPADAQATVDSAQSRVNDAQDAVTRATTAANLPACPTSTATRGAGTTSASRTTSPTQTASPTPSASPSTTAQTSASAVAVAADVIIADGPATTTAPNTGGGTQTCTSSARVSTSDSLLSAQQQLNNANLTLAQAKAKLAGTVITAPIGGRVLSVGGKVGSKASQGGTGFVVLGDLSTLAVKAQFSEADVGRLAVGQVSSITLPDRTDQFAGKVSQIDPAGTISSRLVRYSVVIAFDAAPADLLLGQSSTVMVTTASADNVLYVASAAVTGITSAATASPGTSGTVSASGTVTVRTNGHDEARTVKIGLRGDQFTEIIEGLAQGDEVILPSGA
jgi:multidrug efflux pump subunit AcrA (membrane-fusion protein)